MFLKISRNILWLMPVSLATLLNFSAPRTCTAQALYGTLVGNVTDATGAVVPGATVTILHKETSQTRVATTNDNGGYGFPTISTGTYEVEVTKEGFFKSVRSNVEVSINTVVRADAQLQVGSVAESVQVSGQAELLQTDRAEVRSQVTSETLKNLPLPVFRNYQAVFATLPGFAPPTTGTLFLVNPARAVNTNVNGTTSTGINWRIDGATASNVWMTFWAAFVPGLDAIETVDVVTNSFDAEQGLAGGAAVNVQIKSGTNAFHGSAFEYHANNRMKARPYFLPAGQQKPKYILNQYGGTAGGPIIKNKLFYFLSFDGSLDRETGGIYTTVPTDAIRNGDMSASSLPVYDPATGTADGKGRTVFAGNIIPKSLMDPIVQKIVTKLTPPPMIAGVLTNNFYAAGPVPFTRNIGDAKVNWNASRKLAFSGRVGVLNYNSNNPPGWGPQYGDTGPGVPGGLPGPSWGNTINTSVGATYVASPHLILDGNFGWTSFVSLQEQPRIDDGPLGQTVLGIPRSNGSTRLAQGWPGFSVTGYGAFGTGNTGRSYDTPQRNIAANGNWTRGAHNIRFGTEIAKLSLNDTEIIAYGQFSFSGGATALNGGPSPNQYNSYADFLLGLPSTISISKDTEGLETTRTRLYSLYLRDQWQASRRLTVSYGVRWERFPLGTRAGRGMEIYNTQTNQMMICGRGNTPEDCGIGISNKYFSPRLGLAYRASNTFVIRAGYGLNYEANPFAFVRNAIRNYPVTISNSWTGATSFTPAGLLRDGVPEYPLPDLITGAVTVPPNVGVQTYPSEYVRGYVQNWNLTMQKQLKGGFVGQVGYVASRQVKQAGSRNLNIGTLGGGRASQPYFQKFGDFSSISMQTGTGSSHYDSLQATLERRFARGYALHAAYTWSKVIAVCCDGTPTIQLWEYRSLTRAVESFDRTHNLSVSGTAELPFGKGRKLLNGGVGSALVGGWKLNALLAMFTGTPFTVSSSTTPLNCPGCGSQRADLVKSSVQYYGNTGPGQSWFDPLAFAPVSTARFGTAGFNILRGPGAVNLDMGLFREFRMSERWQLEIRGEALNATNTPHFNNPGANVDNLQRNADGSIRSLNGFTEITSTTTRREGIDERLFRIGMHIRF